VQITWPESTKTTCQEGCMRSATSQTSPLSAPTGKQLAMQRMLFGGTAEATAKQLTTAMPAMGTNKPPGGLLAATAASYHTDQAPGHCLTRLPTRPRYSWKRSAILHRIKGFESLSTGGYARWVSCSVVRWQPSGCLHPPSPAPHTSGSSRYPVHCCLHV